MKKKPSIWDDVRTSAALELAYEGYSVKCIARAVDLSEGQVYYRTSKHGISLRDVRNGRTPEAKAEIQRIVYKWQHKKRKSAA